MDEIKRFLLYGGLTRAEFESIQEDLNKDRKKMLLILSCVFSVTFCINTIVNVLTGAFDTLQWTNHVYLGTAILYLLIFVAALRISNKDIHQILPLLRMTVLLFLIVSIVLSVNSPDSLASTTHATLVLAAFLCLDAPWWLYLETIGILILGTAYDITFRTPEMLVTDFWDGMLYAMIALVMGSWYTQIRFQAYLDHKKLQESLDIDGLTGVGSRSLYYRRMKELDQETERTKASIFIDVNGLHELNNKKGHEAGDEMLRSVADALAVEFERNCIYRIGGDEFVLLLSDVTYPDLCRRIQSVRILLSKKGYHIASGIACADMEDKISMTELVQQADYRMRKDKDLYYQQSGMRNARK